MLARALKCLSSDMKIQCRSGMEKFPSRQGSSDGDGTKRKKGEGCKMAKSAGVSETVHGNFNWTKALQVYIHLGARHVLEDGDYWCGDHELSSSRAPG